MNTGLVTKENQFIPIPYYEIGKFAEDICKEYIRESEANKVRFEVFAQDYNFFKPHLDFLLFELGYKMVNPMLHQNSMWCVENNKLLLKSSNKDEYYVPVCDSVLGISYINPENVHSCIMDLKGRVYKLNRDIELHHENVCSLIINQYLIYDKELFDAYRTYASNDFCNVNAFARNMLGLIQIEVSPDNSGVAVYCKDFHSSYIDNLFKRIKELNPKFSIHPYCIHTKESLEIANKCIERVGEMNENRRLRF